MKNLKQIKRYFSDKYYYFLNFLYLKLRGVNFSPDFIIMGRIRVNNKGSITIGPGFKANSGKSFNPIGGDIILNLICLPGAKIIIGENCGISNSTIVSKVMVNIGNNIRIGAGVKIWDNDFHSSNPYVRTSIDNEIESAAIYIDDYAFVGGMSIILKGVKIGKYSIIGAGSVVTKDIPDYEVWAGNPARFIRKLPESIPGK